MRPGTRVQAKGKLRQVKGQLEEAAGKLGKDRELEAKGRIEKVAGKVQQKIGRVEKLLMNQVVMDPAPPPAGRRSRLQEIAIHPLRCRATLAVPFLTPHRSSGLPRLLRVKR